MRGIGPATFALLLAASTPGCLREFEEYHNVYVAGLDLAAEQVHASDVVLNLTSYLDNRGGGSTGGLRLLAKAYDESTGFLIATAESSLGPIPGDTTHRVSQSLTVAREGSVRLDVTLFEDDLGTRTASIAARNLAALKPAVYETGLRIGEMDFIVRDANASRPRIQADFYLTNEASAPSEDLRVQVKAREITTSLVADVQWLQTGAIRPETTVIRSVNLTVPDDYNYAVEVLVWRGDVIVDRAEGNVQLAPTFEKPKDSELIITKPNLDQFASPTLGFEHRGDSATGYYPAPTAATPEAAGVPGFGAGLAALATLAALVFIARRRN